MRHTERDTPEYYLSLAERFSVYMFVLEHLGRSSKISDHHYFICPLLNYKLKEIKGLLIDVSINLNKTFPELAKRKPEGKKWGNPWFDVSDTETRKKIMKECAEEILNNLIY